MTEAKKCDRCGALYATQEVTQVRMPIWRQTRDTTVAYWDICDECVAEFEKFMRGEVVFGYMAEKCEGTD